MNTLSSWKTRVWFLPSTHRREIALLQEVILYPDAETLYTTVQSWTRWPPEQARLRWWRQSELPEKLECWVRIILQYERVESYLPLSECTSLNTVFRVYALRVTTHLNAKRFDHDEIVVHTSLSITTTFVVFSYYSLQSVTTWEDQYSARSSLNLSRKVRCSTRIQLPQWASGSY